MHKESSTVLVIGASGVVGSGVARRFIDAGATVIAVSRSLDRLDKTRAQVGISREAPFIPVAGDFADEAMAERTKAAVLAAAGGRSLDHVVSVQGFVNFAPPPTQTPLAALRSALDDGLYNNFLAARAFVPLLRARDGASFTLVSGGLAHIPPPNPAAWLGTVKNAALNALQLALTAETAADKVRVNTICIHFSVAPVGGSKNQFGMPSESDTLRLGAAFVGLARGTRKGQLICLHGWADADALASA